MDKYPIYLKEEEGNAPRRTPCFCYVDEGAITISGFETYLEQYGSLWRRLPKFELIYVADTARLLATARRRFQALAARLDQASEDKEAHFLFEKGIRDSFDKEKMILLPKEMDEFSSTEHQAAYER